VAPLWSDASAAQGRWWRFRAKENWGDMALWGHKEGVGMGTNF
jgi:hypothetical protein